jgi:hypothetical protein
VLTPQRVRSLLQRTQRPDTMDMPYVDWLRPSYNCMPRFYPAEKVLLRSGGGRDLILIILTEPRPKP